MSLHRHTLGAVLVVVGLCVASVGCVRVHPQERENLSRRSMVDDRDVGARRFEAHRAGAREGAEGGTGEPGGGCGCN